MSPEFRQFVPQTNGIGKSIPTEQLDRSKVLYIGLVQEFNRVCRELLAGNTVDCRKIVDYVRRMYETIGRHEQMMMGLAQAPLSYIEKIAEKIEHPHVVHHGINTAIYTLQIANSLSFDSQEIDYLGMAALFHNIGLLGNPPPRPPLTSDEIMASLRRSSEHSSKYLQAIRINDFHNESLESIISIIQSRETVLDQTSLQNILQQFAMVIHICSVFVTLTHNRSGDNVLSPSDAMKTMRTEMRDFFHKDVIKLFFNNLSVYPVGTFVRLSSGEIAKVVGINENYLMRPVVLIIIGADKAEKNPQQRVNLLENPNLYIKRAIVDDLFTERFMDRF